MNRDDTHLITNEDKRLPTGELNTPDQQEDSLHLQVRAEQPGHGSK